MRRAIFFLMITYMACCIMDKPAMCDDSEPSAVKPALHILILYSYNYNFPSQQMFADGFEAARKSSNMRSADFVHEFLDLNSLKTPESRKDLAAFMLKKYGNWRFDLIITVYDPALEFLLNEGKDLSPQSHCLALFGIKREGLVRAGQDVCQVPLNYDIKNTVGIALKLFPHARNVLFVAGNGKDDKSLEVQARKELSSYNGKYAFDYTSDIPLNEVKKKISRLPDDWVVIYSRVSSDVTGKTFVPRDVVSEIVQISRVPVFCLASSQIDTGVVGGYLIDLLLVGEKLSESMGPVTAGKHRHLTLLSDYVRPMFNWRQVHRWKIDENLLPKDSVFINRPATIWEQYKKAVIGTMILILAMSSLIVALMIQKRNVILEAAIAEEKSQSEKIHLINHYNRSLIEASLDPLVTIGSDGKITDVNHATENVTGYKREELIGTDFDSYFTDPEAARAGYRQVFKDGIVRDYSLNIRHRNGNHIPVLYNASVYRNMQGDVVGVFAAARDISERKRIEAERVELENRLYQAKKAESLGRMAGAIAHNYNNLMAAVLGNIELTMDSIPEGSSALETLKRAMNSAHRAADISSLMLTYLGQSFGRLQRHDLAKIMRCTLSKIERNIPDGVTLETDILPGEWVIAADDYQISQVLSNLVANAWEAIGDRNGSVRVTLRKIRSEEIPSTRRPIDWLPRLDQAYVCLEVADDGCGIKSESFENLFDPFFSSKFTGRGLGLPVVLGVLKKHQGAISVESEWGKGSVFRVYLPLSQEVGQEHAEKKVKPLDIPAGSAVLLVEDDPAVRKIANNFLRKMGFDVLEARDGVEALDIYHQNRETIRCVLSDLTMPRMNGWETLTAIRGIDPDIPFVLCSAYDQAEVMAGEHPLLPHAFLRKPFTATELRETISGIIGRI